MPRAIQRFEVAIKGLLVREGRLLLVRESVGEHLWELPGGRIDVGEEALPQTEVLKRELLEELGSSLTYRIDRPLLTWIRPRPTDFVFLVGYLCHYQSGEIQLSHEHLDYRWIHETEYQLLPLAPGYSESLASAFALVHTI